MLLVWVIAAVGWEPALRAGEGQPPANGLPTVPAQPVAGPIETSVARWAATEARVAQAQQGGSSKPVAACGCHGASTAEKLAFLYALIGGTLLVVYGPQEKEGDVWTVDGKTETIAGGVALALSVALFRDIRSKRP